MIRLTIRPASPRILHVDVENRPLAYLGQDFTSGEITAIAVSWADSPDVRCWLLGVDPPVMMLRNFCGFYARADIVTGHYILRHDLPLLNGAMLERGLAPLAPIYVSDTKVHLVKRKYLSASQEALSGMLGLIEHKHHLSNHDWREANRLTPEGIVATRKRVIDDVLQHKALRAILLTRGALKPSTLWQP